MEVQCSDETGLETVGHQSSLTTCDMPFPLGTDIPMRLGIAAGVLGCFDITSLVCMLSLDFPASCRLVSLWLISL